MYFGLHMTFVLCPTTLTTYWPIADNVGLQWSLDSAKTWFQSNSSGQHQHIYTDDKQIRGFPEFQWQEYLKMPWIMLPLTTQECHKMFSKRFTFVLKNVKLRFDRSSSMFIVEKTLLTSHVIKINMFQGRQWAFDKLPCKCQVHGAVED
jgi:hypothetical protein